MDLKLDDNNESYFNIFSFFKSKLKKVLNLNNKSNNNEYLWKIKLNIKWLSKEDFVFSKEIIVINKYRWIKEIFEEFLDIKKIIINNIEYKILKDNKELNLNGKIYNNLNNNDSLLIIINCFNIDKFLKNEDNFYPLFDYSKVNTYPNKINLFKMNFNDLKKVINFSIFNKNCIIKFLNEVNLLNLDLRNKIILNKLNIAINLENNKDEILSMENSILKSKVIIIFKNIFEKEDSYEIKKLKLRKISNYIKNLNGKILKIKLNKNKVKIFFNSLTSLIIDDYIKEEIF